MPPIKISVKKGLILLLVGLFAALILVFFTWGEVSKISKSEILYVDKGLAAPRTIRFSPTPLPGFSFFANVNITPIARKRNPRDTFPIFTAQDGEFSFQVSSEGVPVIYWGSKKPLFPGKQQKKAPQECKISWERWNQVGFVFKEGLVTTYINGRKAWETATANKTISFSEIEMLPHETNPGSPGTNLKGSMEYPIFAARGISVQHILELQRDSRLYDGLSVKIFLLSVLTILLGVFTLAYLKPLVTSPGSPGSPGDRFLRRQVYYVFSVISIFFVVFNTGHSAAVYSNQHFRVHGPWNPGVYFTFLIVMGLAFLAAFALQKTARVGMRRCVLYTGGVTVLLIFIVALSALPRFAHFYPVIFNILFSLFFTLVIAAPNILALRNSSAT